MEIIRLLMTFANALKVFETFFITLFIIHISASAPNARESIYLIYGQIGTDLYQGMPFPTEIYKYDTTNHSLVKLWATKEHDRTTNLLNLPELGKLVIYENNNVFKIFDYWHMPEYDSLDLRRMGPLNDRCYYLHSKKNNDLILIPDYDIDPVKGRILDDKYIDITNGNELHIRENTLNDYEMVPAGIISPLGNGTDNICTINIDSLGVITARSLMIDLGSYVVPSDLIQTSSSRGWNIIANGNNYLAILSVPELHGLFNRELLIYNKLSRKWASILIPGARTAPTIVNNFLAGIISGVEPNTYDELLIGNPPKLSDSTVIINPMTAVQFTVKLGEDSEVLWIENSTAYYRAGNSLFTAQIQDNSFVNKQLILKDEKIKHIHWVFMNDQ